MVACRTSFAIRNPYETHKDSLENCRKHSIPIRRRRMAFTCITRSNLERDFIQITVHRMRHIISAQAFAKAIALILFETDRFSNSRNVAPWFLYRPRRPRAEAAPRVGTAWQNHGGPAWDDACCCSSDFDIHARSWLARRRDFRAPVED